MIDWGTISEVFVPVRKNLTLAPVSMAALLCAIAIGCVEYAMWGRTDLEDGIPLILLLLLAAYDRMRPPLCPAPSSKSRLAGWICIAVAVAAIAASSFVGDSDFLPALSRNTAILCVILGFILRQDGTSAALRLLPIFILAILIIPFYEYLILEFSYPLRLVSTAVSAWLLKLCAINVSYDGTSMILDGQIISITDACSGISLLGLLFFLEYYIARSIDSAAWKKSCWASLVVLWIILGNALRILVTMLLYRAIGPRVFERDLHFALGCFFVVVASLLIWFSSFIFNLDKPAKGKG